MKVKDIIKKQTTIIAIAVVLVAVAAISVSYAVFFDVKSNGENQVITAGTLKLTLSNFNALDLSTPMSTENGEKSAGVTYTVQNTNSNLPATYSIYIYADSANTLDTGYIKIKIDGQDTKVLNTIQDDNSLTTEEKNGKTYYKIDSGTVEAGKSLASKNLKVWIDEDLITDELEGKKVDLKLYIVSEVDETKDVVSTP